MSGLRWLTLIVYANRATGVLTLMVLAKVLPPQDFGVVAVASMFVELLRITRDLGLGEAVIYYRNESEDFIDTAHAIVVGAALVLFVLSALAAPWVAAFYQNSQLTLVLIVMATNLVWDALRAVPRALYRKQVHFRALVVPEVVPVGIAAILSVFMALSGYGVWSLVARTVVHSLLAAAIIGRSPDYRRPRLRFHRQHATKLLGYGRFVAGTTVLLVLVANIDSFYVSRFAGLAAVGTFELARRLSELPIRELSNVIGSVMFPVFTKLERTGDKLRQSFVRTLKYAAMVAAPIALTVAAFGPPLTEIVYGPAWHALAVPLQFLALYSFSRAMSALVHDVMRAVGRPELPQRFTLGRLLSLGVLGIPATLYFGVVGMSALLMLTNATALTIEFAMACELLHLPALRSAAVVATPVMWSAIAAGAPYVVTVHVLHNAGVVALACAGVVGIALYIAAIYTFDRSAVDDAASMLRLRGRASAARS